MKKMIVFWFFIVGLLVLLYGTIYVTAHYIIRSSANEPQYQLANDTAWKVALQAQKDGVAQPLTEEKIDIKNNISPFVIVYNKDKQVFDSTGLVNNKVPNLPLGVLDNAKEGEPYVVTWEPEPGLRIDAVVVSAGDYGYVLAGRSLVQTEKSINTLNKFVVISFGLCLVFITTAMLVFKKLKIV